MNILNKRCCDVYSESHNTQTIREFIHDLYRAIYHQDILDVTLNLMPEADIMRFIDILNWLWLEIKEGDALERKGV